MRFEKTWVQQYKATRAIRRRFGVKSALDYLVGEKLVRFAQEAQSAARNSRKSSPGFWPRCGRHSISMNWPDMWLYRNRPSDRNCGPWSICGDHSQLLEIRKILACKQKPDGSASSRNPLNEAVGLQGDDHLMHRRWTHPKVPLHVDLGGRLAVDLAVIVNEREILTLFVREGFRRHEKKCTGFSVRLRVAEMLTCALPVRACAGRASDRFQNGSV
jgi:hypothetical protein